VDADDPPAGRFGAALATVPSASVTAHLIAVAALLALAAVVLLLMRRR